MGKKDFRNFQRRHRSTPRKAKDEGGKNYYRSEAAGPIQKLSKNTTPTTQDGHKTKDQEMVKVLCTDLVPAQKPSARASLSFSLSLSLLSLLFSPSPNHTTQDKQANKQTNNVTLVSRVCTVAPVRVLLRARSDEYPCPRPRRVESRVGQGGREGGREGIIPPKRFQNPYIKCVGPGIKDPEAGGEPRESQISAKPRSVGLIYTASKWPSVFLFFLFFKFF
jgi:hypothetical protein